MKLKASVMAEYLRYMDKFGLSRSGVIHIGANNALECRFYDKYGQVPVAFFEPIPHVFQIAQQNLKGYPLQRIFQACCSDRDGDEVTFNVSSHRGMASSMYPLGRCSELAPSVVFVDHIKMKTSRAATILKDHYRLDAFNLAVIDTQGADLVALKGLGPYLDYIDAVYIEVTDQPLYEGGAAFDEIYRYLNERGFALSMLYTNVVDHGNAFFKRRTPSHMRAACEAISRHKPVFMSSVHRDHRAELGNDGYVSQHPHQRKFFCTRREAEPWWKVDLGEVTPIATIYLFDWIAHFERAGKLVVEVSNDDEDYHIVYDRSREPVPCDKAGKPLSAAGLTTIRPHLAGRWVKLRLQDTNYLHMRQVVVVRDQAPSIRADVAAE